MNRRQKIIVSVVGIFIVLLALVGITYGYFLTRIQGNTNTTSVRVTTKDLELIYGNGTNEIITKTNISPGDVIGTKDFTVTNNGGDTSYVVLIEDINVTYATDGTTRDNVSYSEGDTTTFISNDFVYTLTCTSNIEGNTCNEQSYETSLPMKDGIILGNNIKEGEIHRYNLTVTYKETGEDQTDDMNKKLSAKVNIEDIKRINPFSDNESSLAYNIINNSMLNKNGTELVATPKSKVAEDISEYGTGYYTYETIPEEELYCIYFSGDTINEALSSTAQILETFETAERKYIYDMCEMNIKYIESYDKELSLVKLRNEEMVTESLVSATQDDYGTSYYYRGNVQDNYVNFANMCWKIVRIAGDGSVKLILEDQYANCNDNEDTDAEGTDDYKYTGNWNIGKGNYGYDKVTYLKESSNYLEPKNDTPNSMVKGFYDFQTNKLSGYLEKLKTGDWCLNDIAYGDATGNNIVNKVDYYNKIVEGAFYYDSYVRLSGHDPNVFNPTLKCKGTVMDKFKTVKNGTETIINETDMKVATLTLDEIVYAGGREMLKNENFYLINDEFKKSTNGLLGVQFFWGLTPSMVSGFEKAPMVYNDGFSTSNAISNDAAFRPAVSLIPGIEITDGNGLKGSPYIIE